MDAKDILVYLKLVGKELEGMSLREPIQLLMIGGGYMLTQIKNRDVTGDIDAVWVSPAFHVDSETYWLFEEAVQAIGDRENLGPSWLNVTGSDFVREAGLPKMKRWKKFGPIHVYLPPKDFILAHKFVASRRKDRADIDALCKQLRVNTRDKAQKIIDRYISRDLQHMSHIAEKLDRYFG
ncbi:MAG TPA: hypothetical protein VFB60_24115 [Ktedonobacteraceae bacterium]|nr:hypothetical protein [Ktedonobacteraceae bacterium]